MKHKDKELEEHAPGGDGVVVELSDESLSTAMPIKKKKKKHKRKHMEEGGVDTAMQNLQDSGTKGSDGDDGILEPSTKRLKVDSPGLEFVRSKKSKHRHSQKS